MHAYGATHSDRQILIRQYQLRAFFAKFNAHQSYPLYGITSKLHIIPHNHKKQIANNVQCLSKIGVTYPNSLNILGISTKERTHRQAR